MTNTPHLPVQPVTEATAGAQATTNAQELRGPVLPGFPGHDPSLPDPAVLHEIERHAAMLARRWYLYPVIALAARHRGVALIETQEYLFAGALLQGLVDTAFPEIAEARSQAVRHLVAAAEPLQATPVEPVAGAASGGPVRSGVASSDSDTK